MENPKKNSVFVHEDFEKWPIRLLEKTTLKEKQRISQKTALITLNDKQYGARFSNK